jgi:hypothetical protein
MGVANSGFFMARNTPWTREFLQRWLSAYPKLSDQSTMYPGIFGRADCSGGNENMEQCHGVEQTTMMDQVAFDRLYHSLSHHDREHVVILQADALNSHFPAWKHQQSYNQVLHLAATSTLMRRRVFEVGMTSVCGYLNSTRNRQQSLLKRQLGLTRSVLFSLRYNLPVEVTLLEESSALDQKLHQLRGRSDDGIQEVLQVLCILVIN